MKIGDSVFYCHDLSDPGSIVVGTVERVTKETVVVDGQPIYRSFCWPIALLEEFTKIIELRAELKKKYDDSMALIYQLRRTS